MLHPQLYQQTYLQNYVRYQPKVFVKDKGGDTQIHNIVALQIPSKASKIWVTYN